MKKILLVCCAGMSTSLLVSKMQAAAKDNGIECSIEATGEAQVKDHIDDIDILLLGPQVRFLLKQFQKSLSDKNIPVEVINTIDYGTMNGKKVLARALELIDNK
ncbi:PTS sugar transporter subunit IIB [Clostridium botulinum]|uniref:PTS sugar transporter subunit IIB n=1 Tax=Clostridium botulinum TaxID=1491 RepID=UPI0013F14014|nr:PTS sugar transporter subunit IIB [Clostridium botulinum]MBY6811587.1 PTS sugar transporter subunit IIB [Clostridium botulinum]MBY6825055.1 PTS sugar transporter subunit IIB [Clostridium botulinum]MBY6835430.1 PTS sugar transporter subunit IIB [Clostridium botulinum]MBY6973978.1 PTS sugar transporter subunit IIB [Clostridium botulinum]MCS6104600.1 PTS sugar transporter subunit IIB [Clostridium botulinum]